MRKLFPRERRRGVEGHWTDLMHGCTDRKAPENSVYGRDLSMASRTA